MVVRRGDLLVPLDRNPLEIYLLGLCVLAGAGSCYILATGGKLQDDVQPGIAWMFYVLLIAGGVAGIAGAFWKDAITGVLIVRAGMIPTSAGSLAYAVNLLTRGSSMLSVLSVVGFSVACAWRAWEITRHIRSEKRTRVILKPSTEPGDRQ